MLSVQDASAIACRLSKGDIVLATEQRLDRLEREVEVMRTEIQRTLLVVQDSLERGLSSTSGSEWQKTAWGLALLNMLLAITLFANIRFYALDDLPFDLGPTMGPWVRAFWLALACLWMILQMYPLALLLEQEQQQRRRAALSNVVTFLASNPGYTILLTLAVLIVAIVSAFFPALWFVVIFVLFGTVCNRVVRHLLNMRRRARGEG
jgi:hypothetical protein